MGGINVRFQWQRYLGELGYSIDRAAWGQGFATEAVSAVTSRAFSECSDLNRLRAKTHPLNVASQRVLLKAGFLREGVLRQNSVLRGEAVDEVWFGLLRAEWSA